jgi:Mn2+/Fe2+ NRAMP family transporter
MLARGWDKTFRGLARWDLITGMAIPFIIVTSCIVLASANAFHNKIDENFASNDPAVFQQSPLFGGSAQTLKRRILVEDPTAFAEINAMPVSTDAERSARSAAETDLVASRGANFTDAEKILAAAVVNPDSSRLAKSLEPVLGDKAKIVFGFGALGMGFSTIIILMLINGYAFAEIAGRYESYPIRGFGALAAGIMGFSWFIIWTGASKTWLIILASSFAAILLPIAYFAFLALMNSRQLMGDEKPTGTRMIVWNVLMIIGVLGALAQSVAAVSARINEPTGGLVIGGIAVFLLLAIVGFSARPRLADD